MVLVIDNYDSFSYNLLNYCKQIHEDCYLVRNDEMTLTEMEAFNPDGFILSPGPGSPEDYPILNEILKKWQNRKPILGICLGFQAIAEFYGAKTLKAPVPVHGKTSTIEHNGHFAFKNIPKSFEATRYHSLISFGISRCENLTLIAWNKEEMLPMGIAHKESSIWGLQFHPEAILTEYGATFLKNWFKQIESKLVKVK